MLIFAKIVHINNKIFKHRERGGVVPTPKSSFGSAIVAMSLPRALGLDSLRQEIQFCDVIGDNVISIVGSSQLINMDVDSYNKT